MTIGFHNTPRTRQLPSFHICPQITMYRRIDKIEDEERLLEEMLNLQSQIREQRERKWIAGTKSAEKYSKMFKPVTGAIEKLAPAPAPAPPTADLLKLDEDVGEAPLKVEDIKFEPEIKLDEPGDEYNEALIDVPVQFRDDGVLGLNPENHRIGKYTYSVDGDILKVHGENEGYQYVIDSNDLWKLLLVFNPKKINLKLYDRYGEFLPFVEEYRDIAEELNLIDSAAFMSGIKRRIKYKIVSRLGSGFLFTTRPPLVIPSDNAGLLRQLYIALAELRAGNTSMRNVVVPLSQEARRKGILPENILSPDEETWVFA